MTRSCSVSFRKAFTLIELLLVLAIVAIILMLLVHPGSSNRNRKAKSVQCMYNLRQVGLGFIMYLEAHTNRFPWQVLTTDGTTEFIQSDVAANYFLAMTNYIQQPRLLVCPTDKSRQVNKNFVNFSNSNISYFVALDAGTNNTDSILAGDRHLALNQQPAKPGLTTITDNAAMSWTKELHYSKDAPQTMGMLLFSDGHVERVTTPNLPRVLQRGFMATNHLVIP